MAEDCGKTKKRTAAFWICLSFISVLRLLLMRTQYVFLEPDASIDDNLMLQAAIHIVNGEWLGEYHFLTISKHMFFAVWLAFLHVLHIPYLLGGQLLWTLAAALMTLAFRPLLQKRWQQAGLYLVLLFNPAAIAEFTLRVYRDNIFPSLCVILFACMTGFALRYREKISRQIGWLIGAGLSLGAVYLTREDGIWVLPFVLTAGIITAVYQRKDAGVKKKGKRLLCGLLPYVAAAGCICIYCGMNLHFYGRFAVSDFTSSEFKDALGAMTRIELEEPSPTTYVPLETREYLYKKCPSFALLREYLEGDRSYAAYSGPEYPAGGYYWALRDAAGKAGIYQDAQTAKKYYEKLAQEINAACELGEVPVIGKRSGTTPPFRSNQILPTLKETAAGFWQTVTFGQTKPYVQKISIDRPEGWEQETAFLRERINLVAKPYTDDAYYPPVENLVYQFFGVLQKLYRALLPVCLVLSIILLCRKTKWIFKQGTVSQIGWFALLGYLLMSVLRCAMIGYVQITSFQIGTYSMYLSTVHPMLIIVTTVALVWLLPQLRETRKTE